MSTPTPATQAVDAAAVDEAAQRLAGAARQGQPCPPVRDLIGSDDLEAAYTVQRHNAQARIDAGAKVVGRKIGLTSPAVQAQLGRVSQRMA